MRYDKIIYLCRAEPPVYDEDTGDYTDGSETAIRKTASLVETIDKDKLAIYGKVDVNSITCHLQGRIDRPDYVRIDGGKYSVDSFRRLRTKTEMILQQEVPL